VASENSSRPIVLVIDGNIDNRDLCRYVLESAGFLVQAAEDGADGLAKAGERRPDVVLTDIVLRGIDGFELCRRLKGDDRMRDLPVIAMTGYTYANLARDARSAGFDRVLLKPCLPEVLTAAVCALAAPRGPRRVAPVALKPSAVKRRA
jgi:CheY-like chemotaxis protein